MSQRLYRAGKLVALPCLRARLLSTSTKLGAEFSRSALSKLWTPTGGISATEKESGHEKLIRAGFLRQAHSGIFHMLPLGARVQEKIEKLLDRHMQSLGASRVSLSSITSEDLWRKSGRLEKVSSELFSLTDRKEVPLLLAPTHEEEITSIVASALKSYKDLPIKLYQITRKYRDEIRPRHGLLRSREFVMKDLYTFDVSRQSAIETYRQVYAAYRAFFSELKLPIVVAEASSGDMGGDHSHEYHLPHAIGADTVATCDSCGYAANDEVATCRSSALLEPGEQLLQHVGLQRGISKDRKTLVNAWYYKANDTVGGADVNPHVLKSVVPDLDTSITGDLMPLWQDRLERASQGLADTPRLINVVDARLAPWFDSFSKSYDMTNLGASTINVTEVKNGKGLNLMRLADGDGCPRCETGSLHVQRALELGHTFYLGTRYSEPLGAKVTLPDAPKESVPVEMGCFGIGISRILGAIAEHMVDDKGLNWPRAIAPFEVVIIPTAGIDEQTLVLYDELAGRGTANDRLDVILDDRKQSFGWKMRDADVTGYPVTVVLGKSWRESKLCEVQCRQLSIKETVPVDGIYQYLTTLLAKL